MSSHHIVEIHLEIDGRRGDHFPLRLHLGQETAVGQCPLLFENSADKQLLADCVNGQASVAQQQQMGELLFTAVFHHHLQQPFRQALNQARQSSERIRLHLLIADPQLKQWPWELLFDPDERQFLCQWPWFNLVHTQQAAAVANTYQQTKPARVVIAIASPRGIAPLNRKLEAHILQNLWKPYEADGRFQLQIIEHASRSQLHSALQNGMALLHFVGHIAFDPERKNSFLLLEGEQGRPDPLYQQDLMVMWKENPPPFICLDVVYHPDSSAGSVVRGQNIDAFTTYEWGIKQLRMQLGQQHPRYTELLVYERRLYDAIASARLYGDTEQGRAVRAEIADRLNQLAEEEINVSFNDLCQSIMHQTSSVTSTSFSKDMLVPWASTLLNAGTGTIVTQLTAVAQRKAPVLAYELHAGLLAGLPADQALNQARLALLAEYGSVTSAWYLNRLYLGAGQAAFAWDENSSESVDRAAFSLSASLSIGDCRQNSPSTMLGRFWRILGLSSFSLQIEITKMLGGMAEILRPHCLAVKDQPEFVWSVGEELMQTTLNTNERTGQTLPIGACVRVRAGKLLVWQSNKLDIAPPTIETIKAAGDEQHIIPYEGPDLPAGEYRWDVVLTFPVPEFGSGVDYRVKVVPSVFRLLNKTEWTAYQRLLAAVPANIEPGSQLIWQGALAESFGLFETAVAYYTAALEDRSVHAQAANHLHHLWANRARGILHPGGQQHMEPPVADFAREANKWVPKNENEAS